MRDAVLCGLVMKTCVSAVDAAKYDHHVPFVHARNLANTKDVCESCFGPEQYIWGVPRSVLSANVGGSTCLICCVDPMADEVFGFAYLSFASPSRAFLSSLCVRPDKRSMRIGEQILQHVKRTASDRGCSELELTIRPVVPCPVGAPDPIVEENNARHAKLTKYYQRQGFRKEHSTEAYEHYSVLL